MEGEQLRARRHTRRPQLDSLSPLQLVVRHLMRVVVFDDAQMIHAVINIKA